MLSGICFGPETLFRVEGGHDYDAVAGIGQGGEQHAERATIRVRDLLAEDYLVDLQVTLNVTQFAKRRFTELGQVQRPGTYDMPAHKVVSLLQAVATAGGYTRIANAPKITVQRTEGTENRLIRINAERMALNKQQKPFEILPDDVIVVGERWF